MFFLCDTCANYFSITVKCKNCIVCPFPCIIGINDMQLCATLLDTLCLALLSLRSVVKGGILEIGNGLFKTYSAETLLKTVNVLVTYISNFKDDPSDCFAERHTEFAP